MPAADPSDSNTEQRRPVVRHGESDGNATEPAVDSASLDGDGNDVRALPATDPSELNSKQRRVAKRHRERDGNTTAAVERAEPSTDGAGRATTEPADRTAGGGTDETGGGGSGGADAAPASEALAKMEGPNSKDRRKFRRELRSSGDARVVAAAEGRAREVAEGNESAAVATVAPEGEGKRTPERPAPPEKKKREKGRRPPVSLDGLPPRSDGAGRSSGGCRSRRSRGGGGPGRPGQALPQLGAADGSDRAGEEGEGG